MFGIVWDIFILGESEAVALHDCDILTYDRDLLARLVYPSPTQSLILIL